MMMPDPDNERHSFYFEDFLELRKSSEDIAQYSDLLGQIAHFLQAVTRAYIAPDGIPEVRIMSNSSANETELRDIANTICLGEGLLKQSLLLQQTANRIRERVDIKEPLGDLSVAKAFVLWGCAHEVFHYIRRHALVEKHFGSTVETKHALEYDADCMATASLYRYLRSMSPVTSSDSVKVSTLQLIYLCLRSGLDTDLMAFDGTETHPHMAARLMDVYGKLAVTNDTGIADPNCESEASVRDARMLAEALRDLEQVYIDVHESMGNPRGSSLISYMREDSVKKYTAARNDRWDEIQPFIDHFTVLPRQIVDNETSIAFAGPIFPAPR